MVDLYYIGTFSGPGVITWFNVPLMSLLALHFEYKSWWNCGHKTWTDTEHLASLLPVSCSWEGTKKTSTLTKKTNPRLTGLAFNDMVESHTLMITWFLCQKGRSINRSGCPLLPHRRHNWGSASPKYAALSYNEQRCTNVESKWQRLKQMWHIAAILFWLKIIKVNRELRNIKLCMLCSKQQRAA